MDVSLYETERWQKTARHEAAHAIVARHLGFKIGEIVVRHHPGDYFSGYAWCESDGHSPQERAAVAVAGAVAEEMVTQRREWAQGIYRLYIDWEPFLSPGDRRNLNLIMESAPVVATCPGIFMDMAADRARSILGNQWRELERIVGYLKQHHGCIELHDPHTKLATARLRKIHESAAQRRKLHQSAASQAPTPKPEPRPNIPAALGRLARRAAELWESGANYP